MQVSKILGWWGDFDVTKLILFLKGDYWSENIDNLFYFKLHLLPILSHLEQFRKRRQRTPYIVCVISQINNKTIAVVYFHQRKVAMR